MKDEFSIGEKPLGNLDSVTSEKIFDSAIKKLDAENFHDESLLKNLRESALQNARLAVELLYKKIPSQKLPEGNFGNSQI